MSEPRERPLRLLRWLRDELGGLESAGVVDAAAAARIRDHYGLDSLPEARSPALLIFGALGATLIGAGLILVFAHNWDQLSRGARAALSLALLVAAQGLAGWVLATRAQSAAWTESAALALTLALGGAIALISQTYHVQGDLADFLMLWIGLAIPVFYLLGSRLAAAGCIALALAIPEAPWWRVQPDLGYLAVTAACLPFVFWVRQRSAMEGRTALLGWVAALAVPIGLAMVLSNDLERSAALGLFAALFATLLVLDRGAGRPSSGARTPLAIVGLLGIIGLALALGFEEVWPWKDLVDARAALSYRPRQIVFAVSVALAAFPVWRALGFARERRFDLALAAGFPVVVLVGYVLPQFMAKLLANLFAFALGIVFVHSGLEAMRLRRTNIGLAVLAGLFVLRFVDSELSLLARGLGLVAVGIAFAGTNLWLLRRRGAAEEATA